MLKKRKRLIEKGLKKIAKMQNLSQNELIKLQKCMVNHEMNLRESQKQEELKTMKKWQKKS